MIRRTRTGIELVIELPRAWRRLLVQPGERPTQPPSAHPFQSLRHPYVSHQTLQQIRSRIAETLNHGAVR